MSVKLHLLLPAVAKDAVASVGGGRGGRNKGRGALPRQTRTDSRMITLTDGSQIEYHASFNFPRHVYLKMKQEDKDTLKRERAAYNRTHGRVDRRNEIQELEVSDSSIANIGHHRRFRADRQCIYISAIPDKSTDHGQQLHYGRTQ
jgi:hypothetical protein